MKLSPNKVGLTLGLVWGVFLALLTVLAVLLPPYGKEFIDAIASVYPGFGISWTGALLGLIYGFVDWYIGGVILAWIYNYIDKSLK